MPLNTSVNIQPNDPQAFNHPSIRKKWIQNLIDLLHLSLLKGDTARAKRAWAILVRCREVNWRSRWYWGLLILSSTSSSTEYDSTQSQNRDVERWLNGLRVSAREEDKPSLLHALVLHLIKSGQYRQAYDQLETYLSSYPFLLSAPLHTYAGLLSFYLAQPSSLRPNPNGLPSSSSFNDRMALREHIERSSSLSSSPPLRNIDHLPPDGAGMRQAKGWFVKALAIDANDEVAKQFIDLIDNPDRKGIDEDDNSDDEKLDESDQSMEDDRPLSDSETEASEHDESDDSEIEGGVSEKEEGSVDDESSDASW
ncbi:hypothetical protein I302_102918 [Kwoniella bestiolae CBS 10118]|uniref:Uncharacterized protein n=1 Tax=Kwoniella bestiolae CBS 10118 TaxID=1296100 RepID=A0A1B9GGK0_9TREE|nr:hypothetical protein I302_01614 [Kwoniella bestiolae CBS 10118]OCF30095.1 hypothetical protein I302_01614 [Kwoniella bestiolae CBS 10118]